MRRIASLAFLPLAWIVACGARSSLGVPEGHGGAATSTTATGATAGTGGTGGTGGEGGTLPPCADGETLPCGSDVGACEKGLRTCLGGMFGPCEGGIGPTPELCNGIDDNCDGQIDEGFHLGEPCDDPDTDVCLDSVITCEGCSKSPDTLETCNGVDDNCNGIVDADCDVGDCQPSLEVIGSTPSSPNCVDFPVEKGSVGGIQYPCTGGPVTAQLGSVFFTGDVQGGVVSLDGIVTFIGPDGCLWEAAHHISGNIASGQLSYFYAETLLQPMIGCWSPCTETGTVKVIWTAGP